MQYIWPYRGTPLRGCRPVSYILSRSAALRTAAVHLSVCLSVCLSVAKMRTEKRDVLKNEAI